MGLIVSVLVACVGVYKFIQVYYCATIATTPRTSQQQQHENVGYYEAESEEFRRDQTKNSSTYCHNPNNPDVENIEIECILKRKTTPNKRFLVTEQEENPRTPSPRRKFVITEKPEENSDLREFLIAKRKSKKNDGEHLILVETHKTRDDVSPLLPLPKQFLLARASESIEETDFKQGISIDFESLNLKTETNSENGEQVETTKHEEFHRDPSPYPDLNVTKRKSSIDTELIDNSMVNMSEVEEDDYISHNKQDVILKSTNFNTTEYWTNKILVVPPKKLKSCISSDLACCKNIKNKNRSKSASTNRNHTDGNLRKVCSSSDIISDANDVAESSSLFLNVIHKGEDEEFRNSLDGVKKRIDSSKTSFKRRKNRSQNSLENAEQNDNENESSSKSRLIFSGEYTKAMNKDWHGQHFCCWQCDESLTGQRYVLRDDHPYCVSCYESVFANACEKCSRIIGIDSKDLSYKDKHWHEACFLCTTCGESLVDKQFGSKGDRIYCGRCYDNQFASRCDGCNEIFRAGTKKMEYKTRQWHEKCFCCCVCKIPIGTQSFIPREQEIYCAKCYEEKFATRCIKCNKVITSGGVTYKNEPWHRECFTCTHCSKSLAGERFTSRDEKPYCAECFGELFAKRCFACNKPITGIGGTKFISFEDRHWHNDCFFCASCNTSLVGRGFITDQDDIICPDCAKQKLL